MTTLIESEVPAVAGSTRRRWPWIVASLLVVVAIATGTGLFVAVDSYQPLVIGNSTGAGVHVTSTGIGTPNTIFGGSTQVRNALGTDYQVPTAVGSTVDLMVSIGNTGSRSVKLLSFGSTAGLGYDVTLGRFELPSTSATLQLVPFRPLTVHPGQTFTFVLALTIGKTCASNSLFATKGSSLPIESFPVTYEYGGIRHTVTLPMLKTAYSLEDFPFCTQGS